MALSNWLSRLALFVGAFAFAVAMLRDIGASFLASAIATILILAIITKKINIGRFGQPRIVGTESGWYWVFVVLLVMCLLAIVVAAPKRNLRSLFSHSEIQMPNQSRQPTGLLARG